MKQRYKRQLLRHIILENETSSLSVPEVVKQLTIKDAVCWSAQAWEEAAPEGLCKAWNKLLSLDPTPSSSGEAVTKDPSVVITDMLGYEEGNSAWLNPTD